MSATTGISATAEDQCTYVIGPDEAARFDDAGAWLGLQRAHRELTRTLEAELLERHRVSLSELELLGRLAHADEGRRRLSRLATDVALSVSRVSRIVDSLQRRGLVKREPCRDDTRATDACLTQAGRDLAQAAQATHRAGVQRLFLDRLSDDEIATLGVVFTRLRSR